MTNLDNKEIETVCGGLGGLPSEPTIADLIELSEMYAEQTLDRLTRGNIQLPPVY